MLLPNGHTCTQLYQVVATLQDGTVVNEIKNAKGKRQAMLKFLRDMGEKMNSVVNIDAEAVA